MIPLDVIKDTLLAQFPVGSTWYDCNQDAVITVLLHFKPRGLVARAHNGDLFRYSYDQLLSGRLAASAGATWQNPAEEQERITAAYQQLLKDAGLETERMWSA